MNRIVFLIAVLATILIISCSDNHEHKSDFNENSDLNLSTKPKPEQKEHINELATIEPVQASSSAANEKMPEFRNCRARLIPLKTIRSEAGVTSASFTVSENPDYDPALGDACKGNLANLWQDLEQYDAMGIRANGFTMLTRKLDLFPETQRELVLFIDDVAKTNRGKINPQQYNRKVLADVLNLRREYLNLIRNETPKYFSNVHAPIINGYLAKHNLKLREYLTGEKLSFCYVPWDNCVTYFPPNKNLTTSLGRDLDVLYIASWDWWLVEALKEYKNQ